MTTRVFCLEKKKKKKKKDSSLLKKRTFQLQLQINMSFLFLTLGNVTSVSPLIACFVGNDRTAGLLWASFFLVSFFGGSWRNSNWHARLTSLSFVSQFKENRVTCTRFKSKAIMWACHPRHFPRVTPVRQESQRGSEGNQTWSFHCCCDVLPVFYAGYI